MTSSRRASPARPALALFLFLFGVSLLTAGGHTYSPDEETFLYVTQSLITRGDFNIPDRNVAPVVGGQRGLGGRIYAGTGLLPSLLLTPLYVAADAAARALEPRARLLIGRVLVVTVYNALLAALAAVLFYAWNRRLGVGPRAGLGATLALALGTLWWVYARTLYAETLLALLWLLAAYGIRAFHDTRALRWMIGAGLAAGLALLTKIQGALALPALAVYFLALELRVPGGQSLVAHARALFAPALAFSLPILAGAFLLGGYNLIRFGSAFETGYRAVDAAYPVMRGLYGQLLSSGKSIFLYAPPLLLALIAFPRFLRQHLPEALCAILLVLTVLVFHARVSYWAGDGAWGPRYLVATLPFWMLALGPSLAAWWARRVTRALVLALSALGVLVTLLGLTINFDSYIQLEPREAVRHFDPAASPLVAQLRLLADRLDAWTRPPRTDAGVFLLRGFTPQDELWPQFLPARAELAVRRASAAPLTLELYALDYRVETRPKRALAFRANGAPLAATRVPHADAGELEYHVPLPPSPDLRVEILTVGSDPRGKSPQGDELGVQLQALSLGADTVSLPLDPALAIPPAPVADARELWGWFFRPTYRHWDHVLWYLSMAGLDSTVLTLLESVWLALVSFCVGAGTVLLGRAFRTRRA